jgi:hypothetical protein
MRFGLLQTLPWAIGSLRAKEMIMLNRGDRLGTTMLTMSKVLMKRAYEASIEKFFEQEAITSGRTRDGRHRVG